MMYDDKSLQYRNASYEMLAMENTIIELEYIEEWLAKYKSIYRFVDFILGDDEAKDFTWLYYALLNSLELLDHKMEAAIALAEYEYYVSERNEEEVLLYWLVRFEDTFRNLLLMTHVYFDKVEPLGGNLVKMHNYNLYFSAVQFLQLIEFVELYEKFYYDMFSKYRTTPEDYSINLDQESEEYMNDDCLKYHLQQRKIIEGEIDITSLLEN